MQMNKRTEITIETHEVTVVRHSAPQLVPAALLRGWCAQCEKEVAWLRAEDAAQTAEVSRREIYRRIERGALHCHETAEGVVYVCWPDTGTAP